ADSGKPQRLPEMGPAVKPSDAPANSAPATNRSPLAGGRKVNPRVRHAPFFRHYRLLSAASAAHHAFTLPGATHAQATFLGTVEAAVGLPAEGMQAVELGFQMHHRAGPVEALEQRLEGFDPQPPLVFHRAVAGAEVDHLGLVQPRAGLLAEGKHLAPEKRPELAGRQRLEHATIALAPPSAQLGVIRGPVADTAIDDGFGLH